MASTIRASDPPRVRKVHLVGGRGASMAAAAFAIRDGNIPGHHITIYEEPDKIGGRLGSGSPENGYVLARRSDARKQILLCLRALLFNPHARREQKRSTKDLLLVRDDEDIVQIPYCSERPDAILAISLKLYEYNPKLSTRHRDSHLEFIGHDFRASKLHRVLALQDEPRCVRPGSFNT